MIGNPDEYIISNGDSKFIVKNKDDENFLCYKVLESGELIDPTQEELEFVIKELQEQLENTEEQEKNQDIPKTIDDYFKEIMELIDNGKLTDEDELSNYINQLDLSDDEKKELFDKSLNYMEMKKDKSQIQSFKDKIIATLRRPRKDGTNIFANFVVKGNVTGAPLCKVSLNGEKDNVTKEMESFTFYYTDELKKDLIEPVIEEIAMSSRLTTNNLRQSNESIGYRSDYSIGTEIGAYANLINIEQEYGYELQKMIFSLSNNGVVKDPNARDAMMNEMNGDRTKELEEPLQLVRKNNTINPNGDKGASSNLLIYAIIMGTTAILTLLQILLSK